MSSDHAPSAVEQAAAAEEAPADEALPPLTLPDNVWEAILRQCSRSDCAAVRSACCAWRDDVARCLHKLTLRRPIDAHLVSAAAAAFPGISKLKLWGCCMDKQLHVQGLTSFTRLKTLKLLGLDSDGLHLSTPAVLASCTQLATLQLHNCTLGPGLEAVTSLTSLQLLSCNTEGARPSLMAALASLPALDSLAMDCLDFGAVHRRSVLRGIAKLQRLHSLDLLVHFLVSDALWQELGQLSMLTSFKLNVMRVAPGFVFCLQEVLRALAKLPGLQTLHLRGFNRASDRDLACAAQLSSLTSLHLHLSPSSTDAHEQRLVGGIITAAGARALEEGLPLLSSLALCHCHLTRDGLAQLGAMLQLRAINLTGVSNVDDTFLFATASLSSLTHLNLSGCRLVSDIGLSVIARCFPCLQHLDVSRCGALVTDAGVGRLGALRRLRTLSLAACERVTGEGMAAMVRHRPPLTSLNLHSCVAVRDSALAAIAAHLTELRVLQLDYCPQVTSRGVRHLCVLPELQELSLTGTLFAPSASTQQLQRRLKRLTYARASIHWLL